jgi:hypothetical protein
MAKISLDGLMAMTFLLGATASGAAMLSSG